MLYKKVTPINPNLPPHFEDVQCQSGVNYIYEGLKVKIIVYQGKSYIIEKKELLSFI